MNERKRIVFSCLALFLFCFLLISSAWAQTDGLWRGVSDEAGDVYFYVTGSEVEDFSIYAYLSGGSSGSGWLWLGVGPAMPISGDTFSFSGSFYDVTGTFTSSSICTGTYDYHDPYLGYSSGTWTANFFADPYITLSPSNHNFAEQMPGTTSDTVAFTLANSQNGTATGSVSLTGTDADQFEITNGGGSFSLTHGQSKDIYVRFAPTSEGSKTATLMVDGDSPCNDVSASLEGTGTTRPESKLTASDGGEEDYFGTAVSISGNYAIVGAYGDDDNGSNSGSAYVFERTGDGWIQLAKLTASDGASDDYFGRTVSISGNYAIVGAYGDDDNGLSSGSAYIFEKPVDGWVDTTETAKLTASNGRSNDYFGTAVSISGDYAIVGAYRGSVNGFSSRFTVG